MNNSNGKTAIVWVRLAVSVFSARKVINIYCLKSKLKSS